MAAVTRGGEPEGGVVVTRVEENRQPAAAVSGAEVRALLVDLFCCYCILAVEWKRWNQHRWAQVK